MVGLWIAIDVVFSELSAQFALYFGVFGLARIGRSVYSHPEASTYIPSWLHVPSTNKQVAFAGGTGMIRSRRNSSPSEGLTVTPAVSPNP